MGNEIWIYFSRMYAQYRCGALEGQPWAITIDRSIYSRVRRVLRIMRVRPYRATRVFMLSSVFIFLAFQMHLRFSSGPVVADTDTFTPAEGSRYVRVCLCRPLTVRCLEFSSNPLVNRSMEGLRQATRDVALSREIAKRVQLEGWTAKIVGQCCITSMAWVGDAGCSTLVESIRTHGGWLASWLFGRRGLLSALLSSLPWAASKELKR